MLDRILEPVKRMLSKANVSKNEIQRVVLVGGSTMIPAVRKKITSFFEADILMDLRTNPQEIVALGAAYLAF